jgi:SAM-dependent methyltransferase
MALRQACGGLLDRGGLDTAKVIDLQALDLSAEGNRRVRYEPSGWRDLGRSLPRAAVSDEDVFLDIGSGKGRVLLQAARYPFRRVVGLEISEELNRIARANLEARGVDHFELITADIVDADFPDDATVVYAYNPVRGDLFCKLAEKLIASVDRAPRRVRFIYNCALEHETLEATGRFRPVGTIPALRPTPAWSRKLAIRVYELS